MAVNKDDEKPHIFGKPKVLLDGRDEKGVRAEVRVVSGRGIVEEIDEKESGSCRVVIRNTFDTSRRIQHTKGWVSPSSPEIIEICKKHLESGEVLGFYVESVRKKGIDRTLPFDEIKKNAYETLNVSLSAVNEDPMDLGNEAKWVKGICRTRISDFYDEAGSKLVYSVYDDDGEPNMSNAPLPAPRNGGYSQGSDKPWVTVLHSGEINNGSWAVSLMSKLIMSLEKAGFEIDDKKVSGMVIPAIVKNASSLHKELSANPEASDNVAGIIFANLVETINNSEVNVDNVLATKESASSWVAEVCEKTATRVRTASLLTEKYVGLLG